mmetsp:Transcript_19627/g.42773  ORF Transcript_19627/g.42773 Transcript_19627/m.42773 type:complete len:122 (-) Transcript_19627:175-540(-)
MIYDEESIDADADADADADVMPRRKKKVAVVRVLPAGGTGVGVGVATKTSTTAATRSLISPAARVRTYHHRRAKARLALEDRTGALEDAKEAAYLGDRSAVGSYGRLIRECRFGSLYMMLA